jgi:hypothetical protein
MALRRLLLAACLALPALPALADGEVLKLMTPADKARLDDYGMTKSVAVAEANSGGAPEDVAMLDAILEAPSISFAGFDMTGSWQCRTTKVGGLGSLVIYGWFRCKVTDDGSGWRLEKLSGSQRTVGRFFDDGDKRLIYLGSFYVAGDKVLPYGSGPESDQVGYAFRSGPAAWRIELPAPRYESKLDIMEFRR